MYESFFGLNEKPFSLLPDPSFFYLSKIHREALTLVEYGLYNQAGFTVLTGEIGSGKTTLMRYLLEKLDDDLSVGLISHTHQSIGQIMDWVCVAFDLKVPAGDKIQQHQALVNFLIDQYGRGKKALLIIDEAQNLGLDKLEEIRLLSNINADKDLVLQLLLLGQPQLRDQLRNPDLEQFVQRISASYHLGRLSAEETFYYIRHRIKVAGGQKAIFTPDACHAVFHYSKGVPRVINLICETALVFSYGAGEKKITGEAIDEFIKNDASHLLLAINQEKRQASPDYGEVFDDDSNLIQDESLTSLLDEQDDDAPPARAHHMPAPNAARTETPAPRTLADEDITAASPFRQADKHATSDAAPAAAPETEEKAPSAAQDKSTDIDADIRPDDTDQREDETEELSLAELIKSTRSGRRWTREVIAIAAGVILGLGLVGWYLFDQSGDGRKASTAGTIDTPRTSEPSHQGERAEPGIGSDARPAAGTDFAHAARLNSEVGASTGAQDAAAQSVALGGTIGKIDPPVMPDSSPASRPSVSDQETETGASDSTDSTAMVEGSLAPVGTGTEDTTSPDTSRPALDTLASALQSLSLPVESMGPHAMKADFSQLIRFPDGSTTLDAGAKRILEDFSSLVKDLGSVRLKVIAHTDSKGGRESNRILSERRAKNVADFIQDLGIDRARIDHEGKGEDELKADPEQEKTLGPWVNRRVEIEIVEPQ